MKKVRLVLGAAIIATSFSMTSCGGIDVDAAADEFCACKDKEGDDKDKCYDAWVEEYKDAKGTEEQGKELGEKMAKCDPMGALSVLSEIAE